MEDYVEYAEIIMWLVISQHFQRNNERILKQVAEGKKKKEER